MFQVINIYFFCVCVIYNKMSYTVFGFLDEISLDEVTNIVLTVDEGVLYNETGTITTNAGLRWENGTQELKYDNRSYVNGVPCLTRAVGNVDLNTPVSPGTITLTTGQVADTTGVTFDAQLDMGALRIVNMKDGVAAQDAVTVSQITAQTFIDHTDTPAAYAGNANTILAVNTGATAVEFTNNLQGINTDATGTSIAFGGSSTVGANLRSVAIGTSAAISNISTASIAIGDAAAIGAFAASTSAIAIGDAAVVGNTVASPNAIAIGNAASANGINPIAIGETTIATGNNSIAIGSDTSATGGDCIAIGDNAAASAVGSIALGEDSITTGISSIAIGNASLSDTNESIAIGDAAANNVGGVSGIESIAIGDLATTSNSEAISIGKNAATSGFAGISIGVDSASSMSRGISIGDTAVASSSQSIAIGNTAAASVGSNAIAIGNASAASNDDAIAVGEATVASGANSIAMGSSVTTASASRTIAIGNNATASSVEAIAIGDGASASSGAGCIAIGADSAAATGASALAIGDGTSATGTRSVAVGSTASASQTESIAIGSGAASSGGAHTIAIGESAAASEDRAIAFGKDAANNVADTMTTTNLSMVNMSSTTGVTLGVATWAGAVPIVVTDTIDISAVAATTTITLPANTRMYVNRVDIVKMEAAATVTVNGTFTLGGDAGAASFVGATSIGGGSENVIDGRQTFSSLSSVTGTNTLIFDRTVAATVTVGVYTVRVAFHGMLMRQE